MMTEKQCVLDQNMKENVALVQHLGRFTDQHEALPSAVIELQTKNDKRGDTSNFLTALLNNVLE